MVADNAHAEHFPKVCLVFDGTVCYSCGAIASVFSFPLTVPCLSCHRFTSILSHFPLPLSAFATRSAQLSLSCMIPIRLYSLHRIRYSLVLTGYAG